METERKEAPLEKARRIQRETRRPRVKKTQVEPLWMKRYPNLTRAQAMALFCRECMGYTKHREGGDESQSWVMAGKMAGQCTDPQCPLFRFRPGVSVRKGQIFLEKP